MERNMGLFGLADFIVKKNRNKPTFLDGISATANWRPVEKLLRQLGRNVAVQAGPRAYPALLIMTVSPFTTSVIPS